MASLPHDEKQNSYDMKQTSTSGFSADLEHARSNMIGEVSANGESSTKRGLKSRHAQMIALGGTIGIYPPSSIPN